MCCAPILRDSLRAMDTGLEYEGEASRKRFVVYWLRPAVAALAFGLFTFLVVSIPSEKEKMQLRADVQRLGAENEILQAQLRELVSFANVGRSAGLTFTMLGRPGDTGGWGRVLYDDGTGRGVVFVKDLDAKDRRAFCWWLDIDGNRHPLAAIDLTDGSGEASIQLRRDRTGSFLITLEPLEGEPSGQGPPVLEATID